LVTDQFIRNMKTSKAIPDVTVYSLQKHCSGKSPLYTVGNTTFLTLN